MRLFLSACVFLLCNGIAQRGLASDSCTISYVLDATVQLTDTAMGKGDKTIPSLKGSLVIEYPTDEQGRVVDGTVRLLHFWVYQDFLIDTFVKVTTRVHMFAPSCNGVRKPSWRLSSEPGFPKTCGYDGNREAVASGELEMEDRSIVWDKCKPDESYWSRHPDAFELSQKSKGKGCLNALHIVGNVRCEGAFGCRLGGLSPGDNPQFQVWNQPMINGPAGASGSVSVSADLSEIHTPIERKDGFQSYNLPTDSTSRSWISWRGTRDDESRFTTCSKP
jgi:hypothetical protein